MIVFDRFSFERNAKQVYDEAYIFICYMYIIAFSHVVIEGADLNYKERFNQTANKRSCKSRTDFSYRSGRLHRLSCMYTSSQ